MTKDEIILRCENVNKLYTQGEETIYALRDVSMSVKRGEFLLLRGPSGSGKSTLLNILSGFDIPTAGKVWLEGEDMGSLGDKALARLRNEKIGFVFQSYHLLPILTARENILTPLLIGKKSIDEKYFQDLCETLGITHRLEHLPSELSGGECQRVAFARAMITKPSILFADEPTGNLDRRSAQELVSLLQTAHKQFGQTILMVTHDESLLGIGDRLYRMNNGTPMLA